VYQYDRLKTETETEIEFIDPLVLPVLLPVAADPSPGVSDLTLAGACVAAP